MSEKFKNEYTIKSARLKDYDYSQNGMYFVTICTKNREEYFGSIVNKEMILNEMGKIVDRFWQEIPTHFPFVNFDIYQIMPNHVHGIIEILCDKHARRDEAMPRLYNGAYPKMSKISPMAGSLSVILGSYKSIITKTIRKKIPYILFAWQSRYYDRIIRNESELNRIREYIFNNPAKWKEDRNLPAGEAGNPENLFM
jgi:putative transposase